MAKPYSRHLKSIIAAQLARAQHVLAAAKARAQARRQQHSNHIDANGVARHSCGNDSDVTLTSAEDDVESEGSDSDVEDGQPLSLDDTTDDWLSQIKSDEYNNHLAPDTEHRAWLHGLREPMARMRVLTRLQ